MDKFYVNRNETWNLGYQRSIVVQFSKGMVKSTGGAQSKYYTNAKVEQHFYPYPAHVADIGKFIEEYQKIHTEILNNVTDYELETGKFKINPLVSIQVTHTCFNDSLRTFFLRNTEFKVSGADTIRSVGETVQINCFHDHQFFTDDKWVELLLM